MDGSSKELMPSIELAVPWSMLEPRLQRAAESLGATSHQTWQRVILRYHSDYHLPYTPACPLDFYKDLLREMRLAMQVYPYHLAYQTQALDFPDPFEYYVELLCDALRTGKAYEEIPKFAAADILQVVGIQSNAYCEKLAMCRAKGAAGRISKWIRTLLPSSPLTAEMEDWWEVYPLPRITSARGTATEEELNTLQEVCELTQQGTSCLVRKWAKPHLEGLYTMGVIGFHVPITVEMQFEEPPSLLTTFEVVDGSVFERSTATVLSSLRSCRSLGEIVAKEPGIPRNVVTDAVALLCRLHFTVVAEPTPPSSPPHEDSLSQYSPTVPDLPSLKLTLYISGSLIPASIPDPVTLPALLSIPDPSLEIQTVISTLEFLHESTDVEVALTTTLSRRAHLRLTCGSEEFSTEPAVSEGLFQVFRLRKEGVKAWHYHAGRVVNWLAEDGEPEWYWMVMGEEPPMLLEDWETLAALQDALPYQETILIPYTDLHPCAALPNTPSQVMVVPLPLDLSTCGNSRLKEYLALGKDRLGVVVGYAELAYTPCVANSEDAWSIEPCCGQHFTLLSVRPGLPLTSPVTVKSILSVLRRTNWLQSLGLQRCSDLHQVEVFEFQESLCADKH